MPHVSTADTPKEKPRRLLPGLSVLALIDPNKTHIAIHKEAADSWGVPNSGGPGVLQVSFDVVGARLLNDTHRVTVLLISLPQRRPVSITQATKPKQKNELPQRPWPTTP